MVAVVLALVVAALLALLAGGPGGGAVRTETWVYRLDTRDADGNWAVYRWSVAVGPRRSGEMQSQKRDCRRRSAGHTCRATVEASFPDPDRAAAHRRMLCRNYRVDHGRLPTGTTSC